ncbi:MAG: hypothetical protein KDA21_11175 [Phycisphaerales bacterium]|nr:hypothetical protein [Phycisphaerales bacterium]
MKSVARVVAFSAPVVAVVVACAGTGMPMYEIEAISLPGQSVSTGDAVSPSGNYAAGTSDNAPVRWDGSTGTTSLASLGSRPFNLMRGVNDSGVAVGIGATTFFGSSPLPLIWTGPSSVAQLPLPAGETLGRAYSINSSGMVVGSVNGGSLERAAVYTTSSGSVLTQTMPNGGVLTTAYGINGGGRIVGQALDPTNAAVTKGFYLDPGDGTATDIGALTALGHNSAIAFAVSSDGRIAGSSSLNSGADVRPFVWTESGGMMEVPLLPGTTTGGARGVNASGWVVGTMSSVTSIAYLFDGTQTYALDDLLAPGSGWDLTSGTSNGAFGIADNGVIVGRGLLNGQLTAFVMTPVPGPGGCGLLALAGVASWGRRRR